MKQKMNKKKVVFFIFLLIVLIVVVSGFFITKNYSKNSNTVTTIELSFKNRVTDLKEFTYDEGSTAIGWLQVQGTNIDLPILMYSEDLESNNFDYGWRSPGYLSGGNRTILLGHNIINVSSDPLVSMDVLSNFEGLMAFVYEEFAQENLYISYTQGDDVEIYKIYAAYFNDYDTDDLSSMNSSKEVKKFIDKVKEISIYDYDVDVNEEDKLLTLKTCTRYFGSLEKQEFTIEARLVRKYEQIDKYEVKKNSNYDILNKNADL